MEPAGGEMTLVRYKIIIGKFPVAGIEPAGDVLKVAVRMPGITIIMPVPKIIDVSEGEILTFYTEMLAHAKPSETPVQ